MISFCAQKNYNKNYPLHYAIESFSSENLRTILRPSLRASSGDYFEEAQYWNIVNERSYNDGGNYLHFLIDKLTIQNYSELSEMIKTMAANQCSVNAPNDRMETPFYLLLKNPFVEIDLIEYFVGNTKVDYYSYNGDEIVSMMEENGLQPNRSEMSAADVNVDFIKQHLGHWDKPIFDNNLALLRKNSQNFKVDMVTLLEEAITKNLPKIVATLLEHGVDSNEVPPTNKSNLTPAFLACSLGHHQVLKVLLTDTNISFASTKLRRNRGATLLHQIFNCDFVDAVDRSKCFKLIIADKRCTVEIINKADGINCVPLHYSCKFGCDDISKELLHRGAYIGHESVMNFIQKDVVEEYLDGRIKWSGNVNDTDFELSIDYKFLTPPAKSGKLEITAPHMLASHSILQNFALHPVISSFVLLKWKKINVFVYASVLIYFGFLLLLGSTIMNFYNVFDSYQVNEDYCKAVRNDTLFKIELERYEYYSDNNTTWLMDNLDKIKDFYRYDTGNDTNANDSNDTKAKRISRHNKFLEKEKFKTHFQQYLMDYWPLYWIGIIGLVLMTAYEAVQFKMSWKNYFFKLINWIDILLIFYSFSVLVGRVGVSAPKCFRRTCSIMILLMGAQCINLFSKISFFSLSLHLAILRRVSKTFVKTMAPYLVIILAFGMSFYALNFRSTKDPLIVPVYDGFANIFLSTISTMRMMLSDFTPVLVQKEDYFKGGLFLGFMVVISIIVFNLLNALAISDTNGMMEVAEMVETTRRISTLRTYDALFARFKLTTFNMFPTINTIMLMPNSSNAIRIKNRTPTSDQISIRMEKIGEASKYGYLFNENRFMFWKSVPDAWEFDDNDMKKFVDYVKARQAKNSDEMEKAKNAYELNALRNALDTLQESLNALQDKFDADKM